MGIFGTITVKDFKVAGYRKFTAEFESAVPAASQAKVVVKRGGSTVALTANWNKEGTSVDFVNDRALPEGEYVLSVDDKDTDKKATVETERAASITIEGKDKERVLTGTSSASKQEGRSNDEAYIYYDVKNQYGESIRHRATVNWSITSCDTNKEKSDNVLGLVVAQRKNDKEPFVYDTPLHVTATCIMGKDKLSQDFDLKIGAIQTVDSVKLAGFVKDNYKARDLRNKNITEIKDTLDADFTKETHSLLYQAFDQNGNQMEASNNYLGTSTENAKLVLRSENPDVVRNVIKDGGVYTLTKPASPDAPEYSKYSSATIEPGRYIDRDESIKFTWLTTGTAGNGSQEFQIGKTKRLQSFSIDPLTTAVADGDIKELKFTAIATDGSVITDYKTIARSSNYLTFTASAGKLTLSENNDGTAKLTWQDDDKYIIGGNGNIGWNFDPNNDDNPSDRKSYDDNYYNPYLNREISLDDGVDRAVSLTATVDGGQTYTRIMSVRDMRHPYSVSDVRHSANADDMLVATNGKFNTNIINDIEYTDQYGEIISNTPWIGPDARKTAFWQAEQYKARYYSSNNQRYDYYYGIREKTSNGVIDYNADNNIANNIKNNAYAGLNAEEYNVSYSIIKKDEASAGNTVNVGGTSSDNRWYELGAARNEKYTAVPFDMLSGFDIEVIDNTAGKGLRLGISHVPVSGGSIVDATGKKDSSFHSIITSNNYRDILNNPILNNPLNRITVISKYKGYKLVVPSEYYMSTEKEGPWSQMNTEALGSDNEPVVKNSDGTFMRFDEMGTLDNNGRYFKCANGSFIEESNAKYVRRIVSGSAIKVGDFNNKDLDNNGSFIGDLITEVKVGEDRPEYLSGNKIRSNGNPIDAELKLQLFVGKNVATLKDNNSLTTKYLQDKEGILLEERIKISDVDPAISQFYYDPVDLSNLLNPDNAEVDFSKLSKDLGKENHVFILDQYGQKYTLKENGNNRLVFSISNYEENAEGRYNGNHEIDDSNMNNTKITGVERGDKYRLTFDVTNCLIPSESVTITAGADKRANIVSNKGIVETDEYSYRFNKLGYNR